MGFAILINGQNLKHPGVLETFVRQLGDEERQTLITQVCLALKNQLAIKKHSWSEEATHKWARQICLEAAQDICLAKAVITKKSLKTMDEDDITEEF